MPNPYLEVFKSYFRRLISSWVGICVMLGSIGWIVGSLQLRSAHPLTAEMGPITFFTMGVCFSAWLLWLHFRELVVNQSLQLVPRAITPNVSIFAALAGIVAICWPMLVRTTLAKGLALAAISLGWFALAGWVMYVGSAVLFVITFGFYFWFDFFLCAPFDKPLLGFLEANHSMATVILFATALVALAAVIYLMTHLTEDNLRFSGAYAGNAPLIRARVTGESNQSWKRQRGMDLNQWIAQKHSVFIPRDDHFRSRVGRWRQLTRGGVFFALFFVLVVVTVQVQVGRNTQAHDGIFMQTALWVFMMPPFFVLQSWLQQWKFLEAESLRPIGRSTFLSEIAGAIALDLLQSSIIFLLGPIIAALLIPGCIIPWEFFPVFLAALLFNYALILWLLRWRVMNMVLAGVLICMLTEMPLVISLNFHFQYDWPALAGAAALLLLAAILWSHLRRQWPITELG